ncbi:MAG TPA: urease accessory UreF family protein, partial [Paracoccaceae bacterium]|nr:urease accessory UreF family protein [Paracoccaceae bacterium]
MLLAAWLSPAYPVGAFAYSHGLERAAEAGWLPDAAALQGWIAALLAHGSGWTDAVLFAQAWRAAADPARLAEIAALARALAPSAERQLETLSLGAAFARTTALAWGHDPGPADSAYPVAVAR